MSPPNDYRDTVRYGGATLGTDNLNDYSALYRLMIVIMRKINKIDFILLIDELFRLVVGKGGLVAVINKKLWREVTKGLNLPSSITSAAFTLRTQYV